MRTIGTPDNATASVDEPAATVDLTAYLDLLVRYRRSFLAVAGLVISIGLVYAFLAKPVYRTDMSVQIDESSGNTNTKLMASTSPALEAKSAASAEIELLRSRMVVGKAVDDLRLYIDATPRYFPLIGRAIASFNPELSNPGLFGWAASPGVKNQSACPSLTFPPSWKGASCP